MKKLFCITLIALLLLTACNHKEPEEESEKIDVVQLSELDEAAVFPKTEDFIGDTMPFYDDGQMNIFYLADQRDGRTGYHPWGLLRTSDYCTYEDMGIVIPYGDSAEDQDIALGTGCVIKDQDGKYHAFYTGHNDFRSPMEAIMHAVSDDMLTWTKVPADTFIAGDNYSKDDFRDPYVFYVEEEHCWWMLVVTRSAGTGVIAKYTSTDLSKWKDAGILFEDDMGYGTNMECPTLIQYGDKWYLSFSDQWPDRVVHYRIADSIRGPFTKPEQDTWDGSGFYAGRLETDGTNLYAVGWNGTKIGHDDENDYDWAGNVVVHQLEQRSDGTLKPIPNIKVMEKLSHRLDMQPVLMTDTIKYEKNACQLAGDRYELVQFDPVQRTVRIDADVSGWGKDDLFGFAFAPNFENVGMMNMVFDVANNQICFYNTDSIIENDPQSVVPFEFNGCYSIHTTLFIGDGVATLYVNNEIALTARMYRSQGTGWQVFGVNSTAKWENIAVYA
jgi:beta-fructofuranosidase